MSQIIYEVANCQFTVLSKLMIHALQQWPRKVKLQTSKNSKREIIENESTRSNASEKVNNWTKNPAREKLVQILSNNFGRQKRSNFE